jgi:integrase/recombinase XerD
MHRLDPRVPKLSIGDGVARAARQHHRVAHPYTDDEVKQILRAALAYPSPKSPWRPIWLFTMLMLAYCVGLRGGEIARLKLGDADPLEKTIDIRETKFFNHRRLSLAPTVMAALNEYLRLRKESGAPTTPASPLFWSPQRGRGYTVGGMRVVLTDVLRRRTLANESLACRTAGACRKALKANHDVLARLHRRGHDLRFRYIAAEGPFAVHMVSRFRGCKE